MSADKQIDLATISLTRVRLGVPKPSLATGRLHVVHTISEKLDPRIHVVARKVLTASDDSPRQIGNVQYPWRVVYEITIEALHLGLCIRRTRKIGNAA